MDDGDGMEVTLSQDYGCFADGSGLLERNGVFGHDVLKFQGVVESGIDGAFISIEGIAKANAKDV